jgi:hypothetical protein
MMSRPSVTWTGALAWRLRQQLLDPIGGDSAVDVVRRLGAVKAEPADGAELAIRTRQGQPSAGELSRAIAEGRIIQAFAFRGAVHLMTAEEAGVYLALRAASRMWELPSWQTHYGLAPSDWPAFREAIREALDAGPLTRQELGVAITAVPRYRGLRMAFEDKTWTLLKALFWQGDVAFGPPRDGRATFQRLDRNPHWAGIPGLDEAGPKAVEAYLGAYGPATPAHLQYWLVEGLGAGRKRVTAWIAELGDRLAEVDVDGTSAWILHEHLDDLIGSRPTEALRLLPGHDQWVLGPGTADVHVVPPARRAPVTRGDNVVIHRGVVTGTWSVRGGALTVTWFEEAGPEPKSVLAEEVERLSAILNQPLQWSLATA